MANLLKSESFQSALIVGIIVAFVEVASSWYAGNKQEVFKAELSQKQEEMKAELTRRIGELSKIGEAVAGKKLEFHQQATSLILEIDRSFEEICYLIPYQRAEQKLVDSLAKYQELLAQPIGSFEKNPKKAEEIKKGMSNYSKYVREKWELIKSSGEKMSDEEKNKCYKEGLTLRNNAIHQIDTLLIY